MEFTDAEVEALARIAHDARNRLRVYLGQQMLPAYDQLEPWMRESSITSMRNALEHPGFSPRDEHERWYKERWDQGWRYAAVRDNAEKLNPAMVPYDELPLAERLKDEMALLVAQAAIAMKEVQSADE